jgi:hypothetical protein
MQFLVVAHKKEQRSENQINDHHHENGHDYGACRRAPNLLGTSAGGKALEAPYRRDGDTEHDTLDESGDDITEE